MLGFPPHRERRSRLIARGSEQRFEDELSELSGVTTKVRVSWLRPPYGPKPSLDGSCASQDLCNGFTAHRYLRAAPSRF
jgi:hypothetical protein